MLDVIVGGVVQVDEQLLELVCCEVEEELGIVGVLFVDYGQFYYEDKFCCVWGSLFSCVFYGLFVLQEEEVSEVCWLMLEEIIVCCDEFMLDFLKVLVLWMICNVGNEYDDVEESECE